MPVLALSQDATTTAVARQFNPPAVAPSTPLPSPSSEPLSPAWCPSSLTPWYSICPTPMQADDRSPVPAPVPAPAPAPIPIPVVDNHWLRKLTKSSKVKVNIEGNLQLKIVGTTPSQGNEGFWQGALEGKNGVFFGYTDGGDVIIRFHPCEELKSPWKVDVPSQYVQPHGPDARLQRVIVIEDGSKLYGKHFNILGEHAPGVWKLTPLRSKYSGQNLHQIHTDHLVRY